MKIIFRVDASVFIGSGHVMRCLTLAEKLRIGGAEVGFITRTYEGNLNSLIQLKGFRLYQLPGDIQKQSIDIIRGEYSNSLDLMHEADSAETISILKDIQPDGLIVDHYALDHRWESSLRPYTKKVMVIDDLADREHDCDLLLDQSYTRGNSDRYLGLVPPSCTKLLGPRYALLRSEFTEARRNLMRRDGMVRRLFVFFGGSDSKNMTGLALRALSMPYFSNLEIDVVLGSANPNREKIEHLVENRPRTSLHVQVDNIAELMSKADFALCAGGSSTWERFCLGLPSLVVTIAENQKPSTRALHEDGLLEWLGSSQDVDVGKMFDAIRNSLRQMEKNREWSRRGLNLVDGNGCRCVASLLLEGPDAEELEARSAVEQDCLLLWHWVNDPQVRRSAFNTEIVSWEDHKAWYASKLQDPSCSIYVIESGVGPVGQVRFQRESGHYNIDYTLARQFRGFGFGKKILAVAIQVFQVTEGRSNMVAEVKSDNVPSGKIFERLGFQEIKHTSPDVRRFFLQASPTEPRG